MSKRLLLILCALTALIIVSLTVFKHHPKNGLDEKVNPAFGAYISAYTSGIISNESHIRIRFASEVASIAEFDKQAKEEVFSFSPSLPGKAFWIDSRTLEYRPTSRMPSDQKYEVSLSLGKLIQVPSEFKTFDFSFRTMPQQMDVKVDGIKTIDRKTLAWEQLNGILSTADAADNALVEKTVTATQDGKPLHLHWEHADPATHKFTVDSIQRKTAAGKIELNWNGEVISANRAKGSKTIAIPALGDFQVMDTKVHQGADQFVRIQFSDPIMDKQVLEGLISLSGTTGLTYTIQDNEIKVYPPARLSGNRTLSIFPGIKNIMGYELKNRSIIQLSFEELKPEVKLIGNGVILPASGNLLFPFQAVSLNAVDVKIVRIYEKNIAQFLQVNNLDGDRELLRVGKVIFKKKVVLNAKGSSDAEKWTTYHLDLSEMIHAEPGAIYKIVIGFRKAYSTYHCDGSSKNNDQMEEVQPEEDMDTENENWENQGYYGDYYNEYNYNEGGYGYEGDGDDNSDGDGNGESYQDKRNNPCNALYYGHQHDVSRNILASDFGLIAKRGSNNSMLFVVTDLKTTMPIPNTVLEVYDYQQQLIATFKTDGDGMAKGDIPHKPFLLIAKKGEQRGYLKLDEGSSLAMSAFDVGGDQVQKGIKGFLYGERGVWRPGDTLFLTFMLEDKEHKLPPTHPVTLELLNPRGQVARKIIRTKGLDGFYDFPVTTDEDAPTGSWTARVKVGGVTFTKNIKIETIMPNRLRMNLDFGKSSNAFLGKNTPATLIAAWLHGAKAKGLKAKVEATLSQQHTTFKGFDNYIFDDPATTFSAETQTVFDGALDNDGVATFTPDIKVEGAPGMVKASFVTRVFEDGGGFSIDRFVSSYSPYESYVGVLLPEGKKYSGMIVTDTDQVVKVTSIGQYGEPLNRKLQVKVYKLQWRWWWESSNGNELATYVNSTYYQPVDTKEVVTVNGRGQFTIRVNRPDWGRYLVRVTDPVSGHSSGGVAFFDWPAWAGSSPKGKEGATLLSFTSDKPKYQVGQILKLTIPCGDSGRALISVETGSKVLQAFWANAQKPNITLDIPVTAEMAPNVYVHVTLIQPHGQTKNDLPIRLYGVIPVLVEDPHTHLRPVIQTLPVWKPEEMTSVTVSEENGKEMTATLAIVDEGLLDLTRFETPDPWKVFYAREALGVRSWDMFDLVMGAYSGELQRILSIGGDGSAGNKPAAKANRFKPMVRYFGPFHIGKGEKKIISFKMPQYIGSVRVMLIAGYESAYGSADKSVPVRKPLMVLGTLPRVVGPGESLDLPVTVFAMEKNVKNVNVSVRTNEFFTSDDASSKSISFSETGEQVVTFKLKVKPALGIGRVKIEATSGAEHATYDIELDVRNPNPPITNVIETVIEPGQSWSSAYSPIGMSGTNKGTLELSTIPPINLGERLKYLIEYPHGCIEQTTSSAFPQLYLTELMDLNDNFSKVIHSNISAALEKMKGFQTSSGGFGYWPGDNQANSWGTTYAGHFLIEAEKKGFALPYGMLENWKRYQKQIAVDWIPRNDKYYYYNDDLEQAYRLYTLALANNAELGAMNRLREYKNLSVAAKWRLSAAYVLAGQTDVAKALVSGIPATVARYSEMSYTYGSSDRDEAMILETLTLLGQRTQAALAAKDISALLSNHNNWLSTQTTAYCLLAMAKFATNGGTSPELNFGFTINGAPASLISKKGMSQIDLKMKDASGNLSVTNKGRGILYARIITEGVPETGDQHDYDNNLSMNIVYKRMDGTSLDVEKLEQGTDFFAEVSITNTNPRSDYTEMALTQIFPSGWEIWNSRMDETDLEKKSDKPSYQDIRDDRVYSYFDIGPNRTKVYRIRLNASYLGHFYLPSVMCEAMYDHTVSSCKHGKWVDVKVAGKTD
jgi:uncharacterized protein YfaS (alpha-2-macroglobulin family)